MEDLLQLADDLGLSVTEGRGRHLAGYRAHDRLIRLTPGMRRRTARSVLAHEIAHHVLGHRPTDFGPIRARQEREANEWAARHLIDARSYADVERLREAHVGSMAHDLDVAPELVEAYRRQLLRVGDTVYVGPGLGRADDAHSARVA